MNASPNTKSPTVTVSLFIKYIKWKLHLVWCFTWSTDEGGSEVASQHALEAKQLSSLCHNIYIYTIFILGTSGAVRGHEQIEGNLIQLFFIVILVIVILHTHTSMIAYINQFQWTNASLWRTGSKVTIIHLQTCFFVSTPPTNNPHIYVISSGTWEVSSS